MNKEQTEAERLKFEQKHAGRFDMRRCPNTPSRYFAHATNWVWDSWQAALASQAPRQALSDAEIDALWTETIRTAQPLYDAHIIFAKAIIAASWPNAALVSALEKIIAMNVQYAIDRYDDAKMAETMGCVVTARAALAAVGVEQ